MSKKRAVESNIQARHNKRREKRIREQKIRRYTFFTVLALLALLAIMFFTPIFNIKSIEVSGNSNISTEEIMECVGDYTGKNMFRTGKSGIKRNIYKLAYVDNVTVKKRPLKRTVQLIIEECKPVCQVKLAEEFIVIDETGKILEKSPEQKQGIPVMNGVEIISANVGSIIEYKDADVQKTVMSCIGNMKKADIIKDITVMSFEDLTNITFNYQSRLDVICGTNVDFQRKLALFKEAVNSNKLTENSRGTINLATTGKAIYTP